MSIAPQADPDLVAMIRDVLSDSVELDERSAESDLDRDLWARLADLGLTGITSEQSGTWADAVALHRVAAAHSAPVPLAEHDLLAQWLRDIAGLDLASGPSTVCVVHGAEVVRVPWASQVDRLVVLSRHGDTTRVSDVEASTLSVEPARDLAGRPLDRVEIVADTLRGPPVEARAAEELSVRTALARCAQLTGAMQGAIALSRDYALQRHQFGRPIARFQAVQHLFVDAAAECALATSAVDAAVASADESGTDDARVHHLVAAAVSVCAHAATVVSRETHQIHGAIGTTLEYPLHRLTRSLRAWRSELTGPLPWERRLARDVLEDTRPLWFQVID